jgi:hypothetical protein
LFQTEIVCALAFAMRAHFRGDVLLGATIVALSVFALKWRRALQKAGCILIEPDAESGSGVRLRESKG